MKYITIINNKVYLLSNQLYQYYKNQPEFINHKFYPLLDNINSNYKSVSTYYINQLRKEKLQRLNTL